MTGHVITYTFSGVSAFFALVGFIAQQDPRTASNVAPAIYLGLATLIVAAGPTITAIVTRWIAYVESRYRFKARLDEIEAKAKEAADEAARLSRENRELRAKTSRTEAKVEEAATKAVTTEAKVDVVVDALRRDGFFAPAKSGSVEEILKSPRPTLLIVEDNPETATLLARLFTSHGFSTSYASTLDAALAELDLKPDWVILDLKLSDADLCPENDGLKILRKIEEDHLPTRSAILTGTSDSSRIQQARDLGADKVFVKPLRDPKELIDTLLKPFLSREIG